MTKTAKLKAKIIEAGLVQDVVAAQLGMSAPTFNYKLNNKVEFKASEIKKLALILNLTTEEVFDIFFAENVDL